jgi:hypothetical protein
MNSHSEHNTPIQPIGVFSNQPPTNLYKPPKKLFDSAFIRRTKSLPVRAERGDYRKSIEFAQLEIAEAAANEIVFGIDGKVILHSQEGNINCTVFLARVESLLKIMKVKSVDRLYRKSFTQPYVGLYNEEELCYIPEILDAAQEKQQFIILNGEKYYFSPEVIQAGDTLYDAFIELHTAIKVDCGL